MSRIKYIIFCLIFGLGIQFGNAQNISVDESYTPQDLVEDILINSTCANIFNVSGADLKSLYTSRLRTTTLVNLA